MPFALIDLIFGILLLVPNVSVFFAYFSITFLRGELNSYFPAYHFISYDYSRLHFSFRVVLYNSYLESAIGTMALLSFVPMRRDHRSTHHDDLRMGQLITWKTYYMKCLDVCTLAYWLLWLLHSTDITVHLIRTNCFLLSGNRLAKPIETWWNQKEREEVNQQNCSPYCSLLSGVERER